jgi:hypothetical protein
MSKESVSQNTHVTTHVNTPIVADGMTLGVIGAGVMGQTLLSGLIDSGVITKDRLWAGDKNPSPKRIFNIASPRPISS